MKNEYNLKQIDNKVQKLKKTAEELMEIGGDIEAVKRNLVRILASVKMLELNISDVARIL
ncbi:MAG TPA: hypothetical protein VMT62_02890 [Syntrophorhabdaceae bacterium]|nr:hypothetical protein [Syntrophorhabdaceae bacterium]